MNISGHCPREPEPRIVYWFVHPSTVPPTPLGFIRTNGRGALLIGGLTGSHMTGHKDTWQDKFRLLISDGYLPIEVAQAQGLVSESWKPPAVDGIDHGIVSRIQSGEI
jgi:hypothetical protein